MPTGADYSGAGCRAGVDGSQRAHFVLQGLFVIAQVHHDDKTVRFIEHFRPVGFARRGSVAPVHLDFLAGIALDHRNSHPNAGAALGCMPLIDLIGQRLALRREANVPAIGPRLTEIEAIFAQPHQDWKSFFPAVDGRLAPSGVVRMTNLLEWSPSVVLRKPPAKAKATRRRLEAVCGAFHPFAGGYEANKCQEQMQKPRHKTNIDSNRVGGCRRRV